LATDFNTGSWSYNIPIKRSIEASLLYSCFGPLILLFQLHSNYTQVQYARFEGVGFKYLLPKLAERLEKFHSVASKIAVPRFFNHVPVEDNSIISHSWFWPRVGEFFRQKDVIVTETGTSNFGIMDVQLPQNTILASQIFWGSIGWSVGMSMDDVTCVRNN